MVSKWVFMHVSQKKCVHSVLIPYFCGSHQQIKQSSSSSSSTMDSIAYTIWVFLPVPLHAQHRSVASDNFFRSRSSGDGAILFPYPYCFARFDVSSTVSTPSLISLVIVLTTPIGFMVRNTTVEMPSALDVVSTALSAGTEWSPGSSQLLLSCTPSSSLLP